MAGKFKAEDGFSGSRPATTPTTGCSDAVGLVDLCRMLDVPVGLAVPGGASPEPADDSTLKRELLELTRAYAAIRETPVRRMLLQVAKAAARQR